MKLLPLAGAAALCAALLLTACAKKTTDQSTSSSSTTDTTQAAGATPAADAAATTVPAVATAAAGTSAAGGSSSTSSGNGASGAYIDIPVYPGATEGKDEALNASANGTSVAMKIYTSKDDSKRVAEWYKSHLPSSWKDSILTVGGKTVGTFADEHTDGDQSVIVANQDDGTTRIQLTTKHGK